jgi:hypothetical protein
MEVKGTAVKSIPEFVRRNFSSRFDEWFDSLPDASKEIMKAVLVGDWYPLRDAIIEPTKKVCDLFYDGKEEGAWEAGRFSADHALKGVYKVFVKIGSPGFVIDRASRIFSTYFRPSELEVVKKSPKGAVMHVVKFPEPNRLVELRIGGWMERALEINGCKGPEVKITRSLTRGDPVTEFVLKWQ